MLIMSKKGKWALNLGHPKKESWTLNVGRREYLFVASSVSHVCGAYDNLTARV